jgi:hypothetical protein
MIDLFCFILEQNKMYFTGIPDVDCLIVGYIDSDRDLCNLIETCEYFYKIVGNNDNFWRRRLVKLFKEEDTMELPVGYVPKTTFKHKYTVQLYPYKLKFKKWQPHIRTLTNLSTTTKKHDGYEIYKGEIIDLIVRDRVEIFSYMRVVGFDELIMYATVLFDPNIVTAAMYYGSSQILSWFCVDNQGIHRGVTDIEANYKISPLTLWHALINGQLETLDKFANKYNLLPCSYADFDKHRAYTLYGYVVESLKIQAHTNKLRQTLDWCHLHGLTKGDNEFILMINKLLAELNENNESVILEWVNLCKINLCVDPLNNPYYTINVYFDNSDGDIDTQLRRFDTLFNYNLIPTPAMVAEVTADGYDVVINWFQQKHLI